MEEIATSKRLLEELLGAEVAHFSYPFGMRRNFNEALRAHCLDSGFRTVANAIPGLQFGGHQPNAIQRTNWQIDRSIAHNLDNLRIDGRAFERWTGRTATPF
jgi:hypothetical protein